MTEWVNAGANWQWLVISLAWIVTMLTPVYTLRLIWYIFFKESRHTFDVKEVPVIMRPSMIILAAGSLALFISFEKLETYSLINRFLRLHIASNHFISLISIALIGIALFISWRFYRSKELNTNSQIKPPQFFLDWISEKITGFAKSSARITTQTDKMVIDRFIHVFAYLQVGFAHLAGWSDRFFVDGVVNGMATTTKSIGSLARIMINGKIQSYLLWAMAVLLIFILWILY